MVFCIRHVKGIPSGIYFGRITSQHIIFNIMGPVRVDPNPVRVTKCNNQCVGDLKGNVCQPYLDDILGYSKTFEEHLDDTRKMF